MKPHDRARLLRVHRWIGLALAPLLLIQGASGAILAFRDSLERLLHPALVVAPAARRLTLQALADRAAEAEPGARLERLTMPECADAAAIARMTANGGGIRLVALDPYRGTVLRHGGLDAWPTEWLFRLHYELLAGATGHVAVGIEGVAILLLAVIGAAVWWPGRARWRTGFRLVRGSPDRLVRSAHRAGGGALAILLLISAGTGIVLAFKPQIGGLIGAVSKPALKVALVRDRLLLPLDRLTAIARADQGPLQLVEIRIAGKAGEIVTVNLADPTVLRSNAVRQITINGYDGRILARQLPARLPTANGVLDWPYTIHTGRAIGVPGRTLALLSGLALTLFAGSGMWLWWSRTRAARVRSARRAAIPRQAIDPSRRTGEPIAK